MKPLIKKYDRLWYCNFGKVTGIGFTPLSAFEDWAFWTIKQWRAA